jgi:hypothetical protein
MPPIYEGGIVLTGRESPEVIKESANAVSIQPPADPARDAQGDREDVP